MDDWWRGAVIYQIYPRSFQDTNGDGIGDLPGITRRLEHVAKLGADAVWLSPIFRSPMDDMGYDVADYTSIDPLFGTLHDFDAMLARAHELGLKVIIDQVISHSSDRHAWFEESRSSRDNPKADWYVWADPQPDGSPPNNWQAVFGGPAWQWDTRRRQYYLHNFLASQPDLNFHNPAVQDALLETMEFWLERGVDGFRLDVVNFYFHDAQLRSNPPLQPSWDMPAVNPYDMQDHVHDKNQPENIAFLQRMRALTDRYGARMLVGEVGEANRGIEVMSEYTRGRDRLHMAYSFAFLGEGFGADFFRSRVEAFFRGAPDGWPCWSFSNHDVIRQVTRWHRHGESEDALARQLAALLLSFEGSICLYQGEELGLPQTDLLYEELTDPQGIRFWPGNKGRDGCRTPIPWEEHGPSCGFSEGKPWLPVKAPQRAHTAEAEERDPNSTLAFYRQMIAFRKATPALVRGRTRFHATADPVLAFDRELDGEVVLPLFNLSPAPVTVAAENLELDASAPSQAARPAAGGLELGPNGFAFLRPTGPGGNAIRFTD